MSTERAMSMIVDTHQWARCAHEYTALVADGGVQLSWYDDRPPSGAGTLPPASGLAFDRWCRTYRTWPAEGIVVAGAVGDEQQCRPCPGTYHRPQGVAVDAAQRLYISEAGADRVTVVDLEQQRLLRRIRLRATPVDVTAWCAGVLVLTRGPDALVQLEGRRGPRPGPVLVAPRCPAGLTPVRVTGGPLVLWRGAETSVVARPDGTVELELEAATDLALLTDAGDDDALVLVVAQLPGLPFRRFRRVGDEWLELEPAGAPGFDGGAVEASPAGRLVYTTAQGTATTTGSAARFRKSGTVTTYRLDSGTYRTRWGRLFLEACVPPSTAVGVRFLSSDEDEVPDPIREAPPSGLGPMDKAEYPPLPSASQLEAAPAGRSLFRRDDGPESSVAGDRGWAAYESPVLAVPGRYLWVQLELTGTDRTTPAVRALRVERPGHQLLHSLPKGWSRDEQDAGFLQRFLAPAEGMLHEWDLRALGRAVLLDPRATRAERLDWLAGFAGLVLDQRWPEVARRELVAEAYALYARRGTKGALIRLLEIYLRRAPGIVEQWQLRGLGGTVLGTRPGGDPAPVVGGSARATGTLGRFTVGGRAPGSDAYREAAHRATVLIPGVLTDEQRHVVRELLELHRPAHVRLDVCELGHGMRIGTQLRVGLTSYVGPAAAWQPSVVGRTGVGTDGILGRPAVGARVGRAVVGAVRVG